MRQTISLTGIWDLSYNGSTYDKKIKIPGSIPIKPEHYPDPESLIGYFKKNIHLSESQLAKTKRLCFYGSDLITRVKVNGKEVGSHRGGFDVFCFDVTEHMNKAENEILVVVEDKEIETLDHEVIGKQDWYGNITGMWQPVELEILEDTFIDATEFVIQQDSITVQLAIQGEFEEVAYSLSEGKKCLKEGLTNQSKAVISRGDLQCWSPANPKLYDLCVDIIRDGTVVDRLEKKVGFRDIKIQDGKILLNGTPFYMKGLLDQDFYPETDYSHPSLAYLSKELQRVKELGYNTIRYHVKTPPLEYVQLADELGLVLWIDLPYAKAFDDDSKKYLTQLRDDLMKRYAYSPSFCIITLVNESWGVDLSIEDENEWLSNFWNVSKSTVKDRLIVDNSACHDNHHVQSDINDYHFYFSYPENKPLWDKNIKDFAENRFIPFKEGFSTEAHEQDPKQLPKIISEFGVWSLSDPSLWVGCWMDYSLLGIKKIRDFISETAEEYALNATTLFKQVQWQGYYALKHQVEQMRLHDSISGFVLTELSDIAWEANGILDYNRNDKPFTDSLKMLNQDLLPIMNDEGELYLSNIIDKCVEGMIQVEFNGKSLKTCQFLSEPMKADFVCKLDIPNEKGLLKITFLKDNRTISLNTYYLHGFKDKSTEFEIFETYSQEAEELARSGKRVYVQLTKPQKVNGCETVIHTQKAVKGTNITWAGDWISGFFHYHPDMMGQLNYESGAEELLETFTGHIIINSTDYETLIGKMLGWNLTNGSYVVRKKIGKGEIILSTLDLIKNGKLSILP
ncbi:MAG: sugar-binding domain-containing protein [Thermotogota bacterium]